MDNKLGWQCVNEKCNAQYAEYVNGCPHCSTGEAGGSHKVVLLEDLKAMLERKEYAENRASRWQKMGD